jgi:glycine/D-amino acid oxidase-like deaminating enzyme
MMLSPTDRLAARGRSHTQLRELLDARAPILHARERETLLDAADALLFDEAGSADKRTAAHALLEALVESGRWESRPAGEARAALDGCADLTVTP